MINQTFQDIILLMTQLEKLQNRRNQIKRIAARYGIRKVFVFGSVARGESSETSDIDFLVEMDESVSALGVGGFQYELQRLLGVDIDVIPTFVLSKVTDREFVRAIQSEAVAL
jgi:predicted nucleotidyltransferase